MIVLGFGNEGIEPISFDNSTVEPVTAADASRFNGMFQYNPLFYHKTLDRFIPWEDRYKSDVWECILFCGPTASSEAQLVLVHHSLEPKKNLWYMLELRDNDVNSPIILARTKYRKAITYQVPWMTVTPGGEVKPKDLKDVYMVTAWDAFRFDTPLKWVSTLAILVGTVYLFWFRKDEDSD